MFQKNELLTRIGVSLWKIMQLFLEIDVVFLLPDDSFYYTQNPSRKSHLKKTRKVDEKSCKVYRFRSIGGFPLRRSPSQEVI